MIIKEFKQSVKEHIAMTLLNFEDIKLSEIQTKELLKTRKLNQAANETDVLIITNLLKTFDYVESLDLDKVNIDIELYKKLNETLAFEQALISGVFRTQNVYIGCITEGIPPCSEDQINLELDKLNNLTVETHKDNVADAFMNLIRMQPFYDGNKRSTLFLCNLALAKSGYGYFTIPVHMYDKFEINLTQFYKNNEKNPLKNFLKENCITNQIELINTNELNHLC